MKQLLGTQFENRRDLSDWQWQKLAIEMAFFGDFEIIILDEPAASLTPQSEFIIYKAFLELTKGKTVFSVTHRLSTVKKADKVQGLQNGKVVEFDRCGTLMHTNEYYAELYTMQARAF